MLRLVVLFCLVVSSVSASDPQTTALHSEATNGSHECLDGFRFRAKSYAFYPSVDAGFKDADGNPLMTLQDFLDNKTSFVTLGLDSAVPIPRGTPVCIPEFNRKYQKNIVFQYRDTTSEMKGKKYALCAVCVRDKMAAHEVIVNQYVTLVIPKVIFVNGN